MITVAERQMPALQWTSTGLPASSAFAMNFEAGRRRWPIFALALSCTCTSWYRNLAGKWDLQPHATMAPMPSCRSRSSRHRQRFAGDEQVRHDLVASSRAVSLLRRLGRLRHGRVCGEWSLPRPGGSLAWCVLLGRVLESEASDANATPERVLEVDELRNDLRRVRLRSSSNCTAHRATAAHKCAPRPSCSSSPRRPVSTCRTRCPRARGVARAAAA